uniref:non-specific serine/threonine protein kinase n=1 Tax=Tetradesmus obliquus TaxID=3088 RepID=A0A383W378_TETOB|eukprot:jgi/Sobl393_1/6177/SZX72107.1
MSGQAAAAAAPAAAAADSPKLVEDAGDPLHGLPDCKLISQQVKARVWECASFCGRPCVIKESSSRPYRHDCFRASSRKLPAGGRLKQEVRSMCRLRKLGLRVPALYYVDAGSSCIYMERVQGTSLQQLLAQHSSDVSGLCAELAAVGRLLAVMHDSGVVHGDLTASKLLVQQQQQQQQQEGASVVLLDLGLSISSSYPEDKGVDLLLLLQDMTQQQQQQQQQDAAAGGDSEASVAQQDEAGVKAFDVMLDSYKKHSKQWSATFNKFAEARTKARQSSKKAAVAAGS